VITGLVSSDTDGGLLPRRRLANGRLRGGEERHLPYQWAKKVSFGPYLELFGIGERAGWTVWGNGVWKK
jgi:hypothetical protein